MSCRIILEAACPRTITRLTNSADDVSVRRATTGPAKEDLVLGAAEDRVNLIRALSIGLSDLEADRAAALDHAAMRLGLERERCRHEASRRGASGAGGCLKLRKWQSH